MNPIETNPLIESGPMDCPGTVLLVDDEAMVRTFCGRMLSDAGYLVLEAASGASALGLWTNYSMLVDVLVTDMFMPNMTGPELAEKLRMDRPELKVLFISGSMYRHGFPGQEVRMKDAFLDKPFTAMKLLQTVGQLVALAKEAAMAQ